MGRSNDGPSLRRSAGARLTVMRRDGNSKDELTIAARTRSLLSCTDGVRKADHAERGSRGDDVGLHHDRLALQAAERLTGDAREHLALPGAGRSRPVVAAGAVIRPGVKAAGR